LKAGCCRGLLVNRSDIQESFTRLDCRNKENFGKILVALKQSTQKRDKCDEMRTGVTLHTE